MTISVCLTYILSPKPHPTLPPQTSVMEMQEQEGKTLKALWEEQNGKSEEQIRLVGANVKPKLNITVAVITLISHLSIDRTAQNSCSD